MKPRNLVAPYPGDSFELLQRAITVLAGAEPTKDHRGAIRDAIGILDPLLKLMGNQSHDSFPPGSRNRISAARVSLNSVSMDHRELATARDTLKAVLRDWTDFWRDEELEG